VVEISTRDWSSDVCSSDLGPLSSVRFHFAATGNSNYGWFGGGTPSPVIPSTVDRINFSNDSVTASVRGLLSAARYALAAASNTTR